MPGSFFNELAFMNAWIFLVPLCLLSFYLLRTRVGYSFRRSLLWAVVLQAVGAALCGLPSLWGWFPPTWSHPRVWQLYPAELRRADAPLVVTLVNTLSQAVPFHEISPFMEQILPFNIIGLLSLLGVPFIIFLCQKWLRGKATDAENAPGVKGFGAWLRRTNLLWALALAFALSYYFWVPLPVATAAMIALLLAYPTYRWAVSSQPAPRSAVEELEAEMSLAPEREQVLRMIEEKKITAEEGAELLNALATTHLRKPPPAVSLSPARKLVLIGAGLVLVGFFLPWFRVDLKIVLDHIALPTGPGFIPPEMLTTPGHLAMNTVIIRGGDIRKGLGWLVLLLSLAATALPFLATQLGAQTRRNARFILLGAGTILLLYLVSSNLRWVSYGLFLAALGYALQVVGAIRAARESR